LNLSEESHLEISRSWAITIHFPDKEVGTVSADKLLSVEIPRFNKPLSAPITNVPFREIETAVDWLKTATDLSDADGVIVM
jgi:hypothetical protein